MPVATDQASLTRQQVVLVVVLAATAFVAILDGSVVAANLGALQRQFDAGPDAVVWVTVGYLLAAGVTQSLVGWLGGRLGVRAVFFAGLIAFLLGSAMSAAAWSLGSLVAFRVVQGFGGGLVEPAATALAAATAPPHSHRPGDRVVRPDHQRGAGRGPAARLRGLDRIVVAPGVRGQRADRRRPARPRSTDTAARGPRLRTRERADPPRPGRSGAAAPRVRRRAVRPQPGRIIDGGVADRDHRRRRDGARRGGTRAVPVHDPGAGDRHPPVRVRRVPGDHGDHAARRLHDVLAADRAHDLRPHAPPLQRGPGRGVRRGRRHRPARHHAAGRTALRRSRPEGARLERRRPADRPVGPRRGRAAARAGARRAGRAGAGRHGLRHHGGSHLRQHLPVPARREDRARHVCAVPADPGSVRPPEPPSPSRSSATDTPPTSVTRSSA
ncbi:multidrug efflux MFS transporter [Nocardioides sp. W3-2-3]|uniref:MFS transporter n=1 Tax=Nocardioides convexus TaxID=2712224 RepID=UPI0024189FBE|nr:MFS transporter [Nocardioides convexus]NHA01542.1 multidrug efflux MFS transporter [Nocardioides convexus]